MLENGKLNDPSDLVAGTWQTKAVLRTTLGSGGFMEIKFNLYRRGSDSWEACFFYIECIVLGKWRER